MVHPDVVLSDLYVWRDYPKSNLPKRITLERTFAVLDSLAGTKSKPPLDPSRWPQV